MSPAHLLAAGAVAASQEIPARSEFGAALGFHIIFACFGIAFPTVVLVAHWMGLRRGDAAALLLARRWSRVMAVMFAVGAVSGTVLSYELGLLWPTLMGTYGSAFGIGFSFEGIWFFVEAIFTSIYLYGWRHMRAWVHWWSGTPMVISGILGAFSVVAANSWMNQPTGFTMANGRITHVDPWAVLFNPATPYEVPHMILAAYMVVGFAVAGVYAVGLLRGRRDRYHRVGFLVPFITAAVVTPVQVIFGDTVARAVAHQQPLKFAAMEYVDKTTTHATEWLGGIYYHGQVYLGLGIPDFDSLLVGYSPNTKIIGWETAPPELRAPLPTLIHLSFDLMVMIGFALLALAAWQAWYWWFHRRRLHGAIPMTAWFLVPAALAGLASVAAMEAGWVVTEVGRQPWVVYKLLLTKDAVTPSAGVTPMLVMTLIVYGVLTAVMLGVPYLMSLRWRKEQPPHPPEDEGTPIAPPATAPEEART